MKNRTVYQAYTKYRYPIRFYKIQLKVLINKITWCNADNVYFNRIFIKKKKNSKRIF